MSGQWEVVGKKRDKASKLPVAKNNNSASKTKKVPVNNLKIEEICEYFGEKLLKVFSPDFNINSFSAKIWSSESVQQ